MSELDELRREVNARHESNLARFSKIESSLAFVAGELKVALALLLANGALLAIVTVRGK